MNGSVSLLFLLAFLVFFTMPVDTKVSDSNITINEFDTNLYTHEFVSYSGSVGQIAFAEESYAKTTSESDKTGTLFLMTDKPEYIPGQTVRITGHTDKVIPFEGLQFQIYDPSGFIITTGNLFPTNGEFSTTVFMTTVEPLYGSYKITGTYFDQSSTVTFDLSPDLKEDTVISLHTDKDVYGLGETVTINGRLNHLWVDTLDLEILQTKNLALGTSSESGGSVLKILDIVRLEGDGRFEYVFSIPNEDARLGDYWIKVSEGVGFATKSIVVAKNPDDYVISDKPITVISDKPTYRLGDKMVIGGKIANPVYNPNFDSASVKITILDGDDVPGLKFTAIPDLSGRFSFETSALPTVYSPGKYTVVATYDDLIASTMIEFVGALAFEDGSVAIDREVYGLNETVYLTGTLPPRGENTVTISLIRPDGTIINSGANVDNQKFSWQWQTPISERSQPLKGSDDRSLVASNIGVYKLKVSSGTFSQNILFKVSTTPENDRLLHDQIVVSAEKPIYDLGEKLRITGSVLTDERGVEGLIIPDRVTITVSPEQFSSQKIYEATVYPDHSGYFESVFVLPAIVFSEGKYKISATYLDLRAESTFNIVNDFTVGNDGDVTLLLSTDKPSYHPGDLVTVSGKPSKLIYLEEIDIGVVKSDSDIKCSPFTCNNYYVPVISISPNPSGSFTYEFKLDDSQSSVGTYEVVVDADFVATSVSFEVVPEPIVDKPDPVISTIIEKVNRISDSTINILTASKISEKNDTLRPRILSGTVVIPQLADQSKVNLMVSSKSGICIIGPHQSCLVQDSTRKQGTIYDVVDVDGMAFNVRYSGPDVRMERFDIVPQESSGFLPDTSWTVEILKDDQWSRFYYKINYKLVQ